MDDWMQFLVSPMKSPPKASSNYQTPPVSPSNSPRNEDKFAGTPPFAKKTPPGSPSENQE